MQPAMSRESDLLFGLLALHLNFISKDQLLEGAAAWMNNDGLNLGALFVERGFLTPSQHAAVSRLVAEKEKLGDGDPARSLVSLSVDRDVRDALLTLRVPPDLRRGLSSVKPRDAATVVVLPARRDRYRLGEELGHGGLGRVVRAFDSSLNREVAVKVVLENPTPEQQERFVREAELAGRLEHPNIVPVYDFGMLESPGPGNEDRGKRLFLAMKRIHGRDLGQVLGSIRHGDAGAALQWTRTKLLQIFQAVCQGMAFAHDGGVIHRDLKPANILVVARSDAAAGGASSAQAAARDAVPAPTGQPKILDFGVARLADADAATIATGYGQLIGTIPYMSPEQFGGDPHEIDTRCDVYALGVIGFELLTGRTPHDLHHRPLAEAVRLVREDDAPSLTSIDPRFRGDLEIIIRKTLERHKELRYASAAELAADIRRHLADEPIAAQPPTIRSQLRRLVRRHRTLAAVSATAVLTLMLGALATTWVAVEAVRARRLAEQRLGQEQAAMRIAETENRMHRALFDFYSRLFLSVSERDGARLSFEELIELAAESIDGAFPNDSLLEAPVRSTIGLAYQSLRRYDAAERQLREALRLHETFAGQDHENTDIARYNLAHLFQVMERWADAEAVTQLRVDSLRRTRGEEHADTRGALDDLRQYRQQQGKP